MTSTDRRQLIWFCVGKATLTVLLNSVEKVGKSICVALKTGHCHCYPTGKNGKVKRALRRQSQRQQNRNLVYFGRFSVHGMFLIMTNWSCTVWDLWCALLLSVRGLQLAGWGEALEPVKCSNIPTALLNSQQLTGREHPLQGNPCQIWPRAPSTPPSMTQGGPQSQKPANPLGWHRVSACVSTAGTRAPRLCQICSVHSWFTIRVPPALWWHSPQVPQDNSPGPWNTTSLTPNPHHVHLAHLISRC